MTESAWYLVLGGEERGPYPLEKLRDWAASGKLKRNIEVRPVGSTEVRLALAIPGLFPDSPSEEPTTSEAPTFTVLEDDEPAEGPSFTVLEDDDGAEQTPAASAETDGLETPSPDAEPTADEEDDGLSLDSGSEESPGESISILEEPEDTIPVAGDDDAPAEDEAPAEDDQSAAVGDPAVLSGAEKPAETLPVDEAAAAPKPEEPTPVIRQQAILSAAQKEKDAAAAVKVERKITGHSGPTRPLRGDAAPMVVPNKPPAAPADDIVVLADDAVDDLVVLEDDVADDLVVLADEEPADTLALVDEDGDVTEGIRPDPVLRDEPAPIAVANDPPTAADDDIVVEDDDEAAAAGPQTPPPAEEESGDTFAFAEEESDQAESAPQTGPPMPTLDYRTPTALASGALPGREAPQRRRAKSTGSFFLKLPGAFVYPLKGYSLVFILALAAMATLTFYFGPPFFTRAVKAIDMVRPVVYSAGVVSLLVLVCIGAYLYRVGSTSCLGEDRSPNLPDLGNSIDEIVLPAFFLVTVLLVCELPYLIYVWRDVRAFSMDMTGAERWLLFVPMKLLTTIHQAPYAVVETVRGNHDVWLVVLHALTWICFPMALMCVMVRGSLDGLNPRFWYRTFIAVPAQYLTAMLLCAAKGYGFLALAYYQRERLAEALQTVLVQTALRDAEPGRSEYMEERLREQALELMSPLAAAGVIFAAVALTLYLLILQYRLIGLLYQTGRDKLHFIKEG